MERPDADDPYVRHTPGVTLTTFHYGGRDFAVDPQWSADWYRERLDDMLDAADRGEMTWGFYWLDQRIGTVVHFRLDRSQAYAFTSSDPDDAALKEQIADLRIAN